MPKTFLIFLGPPASGKGTQADKLGGELDLPVISPGELLRHERDTGTAIGKAAKEKMDKGELVPDEIIEELISRAFNDPKSARGLVLDGYPRNAIQTGNLFKRLADITGPADKIAALYIEVGDDEVKERIGGRRACDCGSIYHLRYSPPKKAEICDHCGAKLYIRSDDKPAVAAERLKEFHADSGPVIERFKKQGELITIDGEKSIAEVHESILNELKKRGISI